jgi:hypothetical protein
MLMVGRWKVVVGGQVLVNQLCARVLVLRAVRPVYNIRRVGLPRTVLLAPRRV